MAHLSLGILLIIIMVAIILIGAWRLRDTNQDLGAGRRRFRDILADTEDEHSTSKAKSNQSDNNSDKT